MHFHKWKKNDILKINQLAMLEPALLSGHIVPDIMLVPLLAYDNQNNKKALKFFNLSNIMILNKMKKFLNMIIIY